MKDKTKLKILYICSFAVTVFPLAVWFVTNRQRYVQTPQDSVRLLIGGAILLIFLFMKIIGKLKMPRRVVTYGVVFVMTYLLRPLLNDLTVISGLAMAGEIADFLLFAFPITGLREKMALEKSASVTAKEVEQLLVPYLNKNGSK